MHTYTVQAKCSISKLRAKSSPLWSNEQGVGLEYSRLGFKPWSDQTFDQMHSSCYPGLFSFINFGLLLACLTSKQHARVSQRRICSDMFTSCHTEIEVLDQNVYLTHCLVGPVVRRPPRERQTWGSNPAWGIYPGRVIPVTSKLAFQWLPCQASGVIGSTLGLVGTVAAYCDWVRKKVGDLQFLSQCSSTYNCQSRSVPEIH